MTTRFVRILKGFQQQRPKLKQPKLVVTPLSPMTPDQGRRLMAMMESYVRGVEAEDFVPSPGLHCGYCDFFESCRAWKGGAA